MARFRFSAPLSTPLVILTPTYTESFGVSKATYPKISDVPEDKKFFGSFRTFGGTERDVNGQYAVERTAIVETWYRSDITSDCQIGVPATGEVYSILGAPENIEMRNQYMRMKLTAIQGGAGQ